jgi:hypothetical protein
MSDALEHMANRAAGDPFFLACPLAEYARSERLDDAGLAARLGCRVEDLTRLRLCRAPRPEPAEFKADVTAVAQAFGIDPAKLAEAVRHGEGLVRLRESARAAGEPGHILAARDDDREEPPGEPPT